MRYLRMLSNSLIGGAIAAAYLTILVFHLNPELPLRIWNVLSVYLALESTYGLHFAVFFYVLIVLRQLIAFEVALPGWASFSVLTWLSTVAAAVAAALMWINRRTFGPVLLPDTFQRLTTAAGWMTACAALFLVLGLVHYSFGRRGSRVGGALFILALLASVSLPIAARGGGAPIAAPRPADDLNMGPASPGPHVSMILLDGASLNYISLAASEGRLPNFGKILDGGAAMYLATLRPTQPGPVWTAVATGKLPTRNGVRSAARYRTGRSEPFDLLPDYCYTHMLIRFGFVTEQPHTADSLRALPLWDILSRDGISVGIVAWPLSSPVHPVRGYIVSDQVHLRDLSVTGDDSSMLYPVDAEQVVRTAFEGMQADVETTSSRALAGADRATIERSLFSVDLAYERTAKDLSATMSPQLTAVRFRGLDTAGHGFLRYADPRAFGDVSDDERRAFGHVLPTAYAIVDDAIGRVLASQREGDLLLVVSGFGMDPLSMGKRMLERLLGDPDLTGTHEAAPDGFLLAYGSVVEPGRHSRGSVVDVVPTLLYFFGLPVAHDMDGFARTDIFRRSFTEERPIAFIPTYER